VHVPHIFRTGSGSRDEIISILSVDCSMSSMFHTAPDDFSYWWRGLYFTPPDPERSLKYNPEINKGKDAGSRI
jgi:hypothetical protein